MSLTKLAKPSRRQVGLTITASLVCLLERTTSISPVAFASAVDKADSSPKSKIRLTGPLTLSAPSFVTGVTWSQDGSRIAAIADYGRKLCVWKKSGELIQSINCSVTVGPYVGKSISFLSNNVLITPSFDSASLFDGQAFTLWDISKATVLRHVAGPNPGQIIGKNQAGKFVIFNDGANIAAAPGGPGEPIVIYSTENWQIVDQIPWHSAANLEWANSIAISPDASILAIGMLSGSIKFFRVDSSHRYLGELVVYQNSSSAAVALIVGIGSLAFSPDGQFLAIGASPGIGSSVINGGSNETEPVASALSHAPIQIWRVKDWTLVARYPGHFAPVGQLSWSSDSLFLAAAAGDGTVRLFSPKTSMADIASHNTHSDVESVEFSPGGYSIASAAGENVEVYQIVKEAPG